MRYQLAFTLGEIKGEGRDAALAALARRDGDDRWMRLAIQSSLAEGAAEVTALAAGRCGELAARPPCVECSESLASQIGVAQSTSGDRGAGAYGGIAAQGRRRAGAAARSRIERGLVARRPFAARGAGRHRQRVGRRNCSTSCWPKRSKRRSTKSSRLPPARRPSARWRWPRWMKCSRRWPACWPAGSRRKCNWRRWPRWDDSRSRKLRR